MSMFAFRMPATRHNTYSCTVQLGTQQHSPGVQHSVAQHNTCQQSTAQHSGAQHRAAQNSTAQHSTAQQGTLAAKAWVRRWRRQQMFATCCRGTRTCSQLSIVMRAWSEGCCIHASASSSYLTCPASADNTPRHAEEYAIPKPKGNTVLPRQLLFYSFSTPPAIVGINVNVCVCSRLYSNETVLVALCGTLTTSYTP